MFSFYLRLLSNEPNHQQVHQNLSMMAEKEDKAENVDKLIPLLRRKSIALNANNTLDYDALGVMAKRKKIWINLYSIQKALQLDPKNIGAMQDMGIAYGMKGNLDKALELNQRVLELNANNLAGSPQYSHYLQGMGTRKKPIFLPKSLYPRPQIEAIIRRSPICPCPLFLSLSLYRRFLCPLLSSNN